MRRTGEHDEHDDMTTPEERAPNEGELTSRLGSRAARSGGSGEGANGAAGLGPASGTTAPAWLAWIAASAVA